jgi:hypothetical protein
MIIEELCFILLLGLSTEIYTLMLCIVVCSELQRFFFERTINNINCTFKHKIIYRKYSLKGAYAYIGWYPTAYSSFLIFVTGALGYRCILVTVT